MMDVKFVILCLGCLLLGCHTTSIINPCSVTRCPRGQLLDIATCRCLAIRQLPVNILNPQCPSLYCPLAIYPCTSYKVDSRGCRTCECRCFANVCPRHCSQGTEHTLDSNGCEVCKCKSRSQGHVCQQEPCGISCANGFQVDQFGCTLCRCKPKSCGKLCRNFCPGGRIMDANGCPTCDCIWNTR